MKLETWRITPVGPSGLHIGTQGMAQELSSTIYHSDTLFSALILNLAKISSDAFVEDMMKEFSAGKPPFIITSAFPFAGAVSFFPLPMNVADIKSKDKGKHASSAKDLKKISFVSEEIFRKFLVDRSVIQDFLTDENILKGGLLISVEEKQKLPTEIEDGTVNIFDTHEKRPRVTIDRKMNKSNLYFTGSVRFAPECGLWFGVKWQKADSRWKNYLPLLLTVLEDEGIGGERSSGFGQVKITSWQDITLPDAAAKSWVTLSRYLPKSEELAALTDGSARYKIDTVGGWMYSPGHSS
jgi:CRISPR-associated protein Csm4